MLNTFNGNSTKYEERRRHRQQLMADLEKQTKRAQIFVVTEEETDDDETHLQEMFGELQRTTSLSTIDPLTTPPTTPRTGNRGSSLVSFESAKQLVYDDTWEDDILSTASRTTLGTFRFGGEDGDYGFGPKRNKRSKGGLNLKDFRMGNRSNTDPDSLWSVSALSSTTTRSGRILRERCGCSKSKNGHYMWISMLTGGIMLVLTFVLVAVENRKALPISPTKSPTSLASSSVLSVGSENSDSEPLRLVIARFFQRKGILLNEDILGNETSPQSQAMAFVSRTQLAQESWPFFDDPKSWESQPMLRKLIEMYVLHVFYFSTGGNALWKSRSGWGVEEDPCTYHGISCNDLALIDQTLEEKTSIMKRPLNKVEKAASVTHISLSGNGLKGVLPHRELSFLNLQFLDLSSNEIQGELPRALPISLETLDLSHNQLTQTIPTEWSSLDRLTSMNLEENQLTGTFPWYTINWVSLKTLSLSRNSFSGQMDLSGMPRLEKMSCDSNRFSGPLPSEISQLSLLKVMNLRDNRFQHSIPSSFSQLAALEVLDLSVNSLTGAGLASMVPQLSRLRELHVSHNALQGSLPERFPPQLSILALGSNKFTGTLPQDIVQQQQGTQGRPSFAIQEISLEHNRLRGTLPVEWGQALSRLKFLRLSENFFIGSIPESWGSLSSLVELRLDNNQLTGNIPLSMGARLQRLETLAAHGNHFEGVITSEFCLIDSLTFLTADCNGPDLSCDCCSQCF